MSMRFASGSSQYGVSTGTPITAVPLTLACWFRLDAASGTQTLISLASTTITNYFRLVTVTSSLRAMTGASATAQVSSVVADTWHHGAAVFSAANSRTIWLNGVLSGSNATSVTPTSIDRIGLGSLVLSTPGTFLSGNLAEVGIWDVALTQSELLMLQKYPPSMVRPQNLKCYYLPMFNQRSGISLQTWEPNYASPSPDTYGLTWVNGPTHRSGNNLVLTGDEWMTRSRRRRFGFLNLWTGSGALTIGAAVLSASGEFTAANNYQASAAITTAPAVISASGTFVPPVFTGSAAVTTGPATASGAATFGGNVYTGTASVTVGATSASGSATFTAPTYTGTAAVAAGAASLSGSATFSPPVYTGAASVTIGAASLGGTASYTPPSYTGTGAVTTGAATLSGSGTFVAPTYAATGTLVVSSATLAGLAEFDAPAFIATAALITPAATTSGTAEYDAPIYAGAAALLSPITTISASGFTTEPTYTANAVLTVAATTFYARAPDARGLVFIAVYDGYNPVTMTATGYSPIVVTAAEAMPELAVVASMPGMAATGRTPEASAEIY